MFTSGEGCLLLWLPPLLLFVSCWGRSASLNPNDFSTESSEFGLGEAEEEDAVEKLRSRRSFRLLPRRVSDPFVVRFRFLSPGPPEEEKEEEEEEEEAAEG